METLSLQDVLVKEFAKEVESRPKLNQTIKKNYSKLTLNQIIEIQESSNDPIVQKFLSALLLIKLEEEAPKGSQYFKILNNGLILLEAASQYMHAIVKCCDSILIKELSKCKELDENMLLLSYSKNIKEKSEIEMKGFKQNELEILASLWNKAGEICDSDDIGLIMKTLENVNYVQSNLKSLNLETLIITFQTTSITYIENKIGINNRISKKYLKEFHSILDLLKKLQSDDDTYYSEIEEARRLCTDKEVSLINDFEYSQLSEDSIYEIDPSVIKKIDPPIYAIKSKYFQVCIYRAIYNNVEVAVKMYQSVNSEADWNSIFTEIRIYQRFSAMANINNCFLRYYGTYVDQTSINMVMEYYTDNLMKYITHLQTQNYIFSEMVIGPIFYKLITSFHIMEEQGIFHGDIKPQNFLVDQYWNIKIIDFSISIVKNEDIRTFATGLFPLQGTDGYMSPEIEEAKTNRSASARYNPEKSDVFSLGLVFLQMLTYKNLKGLNTFKNNRKLFEIISTVPYSWARMLLEKMLNADPAQRWTFKKLLGIVVMNNTETN